MPFGLLDQPRWFVRQEALGGEAVYEILEIGDEIATAEVVRAPGLRSGKRIRLLAAAARRMETVDLDAGAQASEPTDGVAEPAGARLV
jgi:hypothetical protein